ncbi:MAG: aspartate aminotransferase family protein, partial [Xanthobacteraceae bacterium]
AAIPDAVGKRAYRALEHAFHQEDVMVRSVGDTLALTPPLTISEAQLDELFDKVGKVIKAVA